MHCNAAQYNQCSAILRQCNTMHWSPISAGEACGVEKSQSGADETNLVVTSQKSYNFFSISDVSILKIGLRILRRLQQYKTGLLNPLV